MDRNEKVLIMIFAHLIIDELQYMGGSHLFACILMSSHVSVHSRLEEYPVVCLLIDCLRRMPDLELAPSVQV